MAIYGASSGKSSNSIQPPVVHISEKEREMLKHAVEVIDANKAFRPTPLN